MVSLDREFNVITEFKNELKPEDIKIFLYSMPIKDINERHSENYAIVQELKKINENPNIVFNEYIIASFNPIINWGKYKDIDVIFAVDDEAFEFVKSEVLNPDSIMYHKQILFTGINGNVELTDEHKKYITGILQSNTDELFNLILYLHPNIDTINVIIDEFTYSNMVKERIESSKYLFFRSVKINFIQSNYIEDIQNKLKKIDDKNQAIILTGTFMYKNDNSHVMLKDVVNDIKDITKNPIYTNNYAYVFNGVIGGVVAVGEYQGSYVAKEIINILEGNKEEYDILPKPSGVFMFDYKQIYKYNIDTLKIPKDSTILNKPKYKLLLPKSIKITIFIVFILLISIGIYVVYKFIAERKKSTRNKQLYEKAKEREKTKSMVNSCLFSSCCKHIYSRCIRNRNVLYAKEYEQQHSKCGSCKCNNTIG